LVVNGSVPAEIATKNAAALMVKPWCRGGDREAHRGAFVTEDMKDRNATQAYIRGALIRVENEE